MQITLMMPVAIAFTGLPYAQKPAPTLALTGIRSIEKKSGWQIPGQLKANVML